MKSVCVEPCHWGSLLSWLVGILLGTNSWQVKVNTPGGLQHLQFNLSVFTLQWLGQSIKQTNKQSINEINELTNDSSHNQGSQIQQVWPFAVFFVWVEYESIQNLLLPYLCFMFHCLFVWFGVFLFWFFCIYRVWVGHSTTKHHPISSRERKRIGLPYQSAIPPPSDKLKSKGDRNVFVFVSFLVFVFVLKRENR